MPSRGFDLALLLLAPLAALAMFQGAITAGLLPLALFGPAYAVARLASPVLEESRAIGARVVAAASVGAGLALVPAILFLAQGVDPLPSRFATAGVAILGAGLGSLAGLATAPAARPLGEDDARKWVLSEALTQDQARGLVMLFLVAVPAGLLLAVLRQAPLFPGAGGEVLALPRALLGGATASGYLTLPSSDAAFVLAIPLTLAPFALGFLTPVPQSFLLSIGGLVFLAVAPLAIAFDLPVETPGGALVGLSLRPNPGLDVIVALAPAAAGALVGVATVAALRAPPSASFAGRALWAAVGALVALFTHGVLVGLLLAVGVCAGALLVSVRSPEARLAPALGLGVVAGAAGRFVLPAGEALLAGALVGVVCGAAIASAATARALVLPRESVRTGRGILAIVVAIVVAGGLAFLAAHAVVARSAPFEAPHARALAAAVDAVVTGRAAPLVLWGVAAGALVQVLTRRGAPIAVGFLAGPVAVLFVLLGSLGRSWWESRLLARARDGYVVKGELGYSLLRMHVAVAAVLAGEALALALAGWAG